MSNLKAYIAICILACVVSLWGAHALSDAGSAAAVWAGEEETGVTVIIDAGHGGEDGGALSANGVRESGVNLEISLRLRDLLHFLGIQTKMIRETDVSVSTEGTTIAQRKVSDIHNRVSFVEETENALLISIHQNHFSQSKYRGAQVFYAGTAGSDALAEELQNTLAAQVDPNNHRLCKAAKDVYLLKHIHCPAVLVECGFLSNPEEAALLQEPEYQKKLAAALGACIASYTEEGNEV